MASTEKSAENSSAATASGSNKKQAELEQRLKALERQNAALVKENQQRGPFPVVPSSTVKVSDVPGPLHRKIKDVVKTKIFRSVKFVPTSDKDEMKVGRKIFGYLELEIAQLQGMTKPEKESWIRAHLNVFAAAINNARSYAISEMKKVAMKYYETHGDSLPTIEQILACATRKIDLTKEDETKIFRWYWDVLLPKACGNMTDWGKDKRHYATISLAAPKDNPSKPYVTPSTEAFCVLQFHNNRENWASMAAIKKEHPNCTQLVQGKKGGGDGQPYIVAGETIKLFGDKFKPVWSESDSGSSRKGGFRKEGLVQYKTYCDQVAAARKDPKTPDVEAGFLKMLREDLEITSLTEEEEKAKKKRKRLMDDDFEDQNELVAMDDFSDSEDEEELELPEDNEEEDDNEEEEGE